MNTDFQVFPFPLSSKSPSKREMELGELSRDSTTPSPGEALKSGWFSHVLATCNHPTLGVIELILRHLFYLSESLEAHFGQGYYVKIPTGWVQSDRLGWVQGGFNKGSVKKDVGRREKDNRDVQYSKTGKEGLLPREAQRKLEEESPEEKLSDLLRRPEGGGCREGEHAGFPPLLSCQRPLWAEPGGMSQKAQDPGQPHGKSRVRKG